MNPGRPEFDELLEAFLDGRRTPEERAELAPTPARLAELDAALAEQEALDRSLRRLYEPSNAAAVVQGIGRSAEDRAREPLLRMRTRPVARWLAAAAAVAVLGVGVSYFALKRTGTPRGQMSIFEVYAEHVAHNMDPNRVCNDPQAFAGGVWRKTGQGLQFVDPMPAGVRMTGFARGRAFRRNVLLILALADDTPVVVFLLPKHVADQERSCSSQDGLNVFRRDIGEAAVIEVTPLDKPRVLDLLEDPHKPVEYYQSAPW